MGSCLQLRLRQIARNILFNWFGTVANLVVGVFFAPFVLHRLGDVAYGIWVLAVSTVAYLSLLDLGMQSSVLRFVSKGYTQGDHQGASEAMSAALWVRLRISMVVLGCSLALSAFFPILFKLPASFALNARVAVLIIGFTTALTMSFGVAGGVLSGLNRYDLQNSVSLTQTAVRVITVVIVLRTGHGIVAIALSELLATCIGLATLSYFARRLYPELKLHLSRPKRETLRTVWAYSAYAFLTTIAVQLVYQTDNLVVGAFVSTGAVTLYAIGNSLCRYATQVVGAIAGTFVPAASTYEAAGNTDALLRLFFHGTRVTLAVSLPILITFLVRGRTFISLWMGAQYAHTSYAVLVLLSIPLFFAFANRTAGSIAYGVEKHKPMAVWAIVEGVSNLILSVILVRRYGIYGVALGTLIPSLLVQIGFWPWYTSTLVNVSVREIYWKVWGRMFLAATPFAAVSYAVEKAYPPKHLLQFLLQIAGTLPVFLLVLALVYQGYVRAEVLPKLRGLLRPNAAA